MAAAEVFANQPLTTVASGGTSAPAPGTTETWTVASSASFPAAATGVSQFRVADVASATEIILVTNVSGATWSVTRGAESTTPVAHAAGFTVQQVVSAGVLGAFSQGGTLPLTTLGDLLYEDATPAAARLAGNTSATKKFLAQTGNGTISAAPGWGTIAAGDVPTLNQNTTGTAAGLSSTLGVGSGGTGQATAPAAITALTGTQASGKYLRSDGTNAALANIAAGDVPTLNQNTTGTAAGLSATLAVGSGGTGSATRNFAGLMTPTGVKTADYPAAAGDFVVCDTTSGSITITLPAGPPNLTAIGVKAVIQGGTNTVTITRGGSDVFNKAGGSTSLTMDYVLQSLIFQYASGPGIWYVYADDLPRSGLDTRYAQLANNLSDLPSASTARTNLGLTGAATAALPIAVANGGTGQTTASAAFSALSPNTTLGDITYGSGTNTSTRLAGSTSATKTYLTQTGNGTISAAPAWGAIAAADLPAATTSTQGAVQLDSTASDIKALGTQAAGTSTKAPAADHVHPPTGLTSSTVYKQVTSALTPSATINTLGSTVTQTPDSGFTALFPTGVTFAASSVVSETVTVQITVTWNDATTTVFSPTTTTSTTTNLSVSQMVSLMAGGDGKRAVSIAWAIKSSIGSSTASVTATVLGLNQY